MNKTYLEKLRDPKWQKKRLEIFNRDEWTCQVCLATKQTLNVHHKYYLPKTDPWDYPNDALITLCEECHLYEKERRKDVERDLLFNLKKHFLSDDIAFLSQVFEKTTLCHSRDVVISVLEWVLCNEDTQRRFISEYFDFLR